MTREEAIEKFGEPLTLEQLLEMDGKPVWTKLLVENTGRKEGWALIYSDDGHTAVQRWTQSPLWYKDYGKTWIAYAYPPAHIDRKAWEPCEKCKHSVDYGLGKRMEGGWRANMHISEIIRRAEKEVATATRNLDAAKRRSAPDQDVQNLEEKVEYRKTALQILKNSADVTILIDKINKKDKAIKALCYDFVDFATSGLYNMAPYCANMTNKCIHQNGWCKTDINSCKGFYPKAAIESED